MLDGLMWIMNTVFCLALLFDWVVWDEAQEEENR